MPEVRVDEVLRFMVEALRAAGAPASEAEAHAALLLHADITGHFSHGLNRLVFYINDIKKGAVNANAKPTILKEAAATAWVDGGGGLGATVGNFCMDLAIKKARESGVGVVSAKGGLKTNAKPTILKEAAATAWVDGGSGLGATVGNFCMNLAIKKARESGVGVVSAKGCTHFGMAGYWALKAERQGLIGLAFTNSSPVMVPTRAKDAAMGTNPIAFFAPAANGDSLGVDMASTAVALGKIEVQIHKGEPIPQGWAYGPDGKPTTDAQLAFDTYRLMPLGGMEATSGYKGYGLSAAIEVLCGGLSGANMSYQNGPWSIEGAASPPNLGQCFMAIDPGQFAPGFGERIAAGLQHWRSLEPMDPSLPVLAPGDKERANAEQTKKKGTISYARNMIDMYARVAQHLGVKPMEVLE